MCQLCDNKSVQTHRTWAELGPSLGPGGSSSCLSLTAGIPFVGMHTGNGGWKGNTSGMIQTIEGKDEFLCVCVCPTKYCVISFRPAILSLFRSGIKKGSTLESSYPYKMFKKSKRQQLSNRHNGGGHGGVGQLGNPTKDDNVQFFLLLSIISTQS